MTPIMIHADVLNRTGTAQCGACTPGIVVAIRWLMDHPAVADRIGLRAYMSGNLCRCTGYDGVIAGVQQALQQGGAE